MARTLWLLAGLGAAAGAALALALATGSVALAPGALGAVLTGGGEPMARELVLGLRLPRAAGAFAVGALLALAGALMQVLLRNPLADPYVLGTSGGAAVGALGAMLLGLAAPLVGGAAFAGALASTVLVFSLARAPGDWAGGRLLLTGVVVAAGWGAVVGFLLTLGADQRLKGMVFWLMGDTAQILSPLPGLVALPLVLGAALALARPLNVLARGEVQAAALGVAVGPLRGAVYALAALATAVAVTLAGSVGFVGLVVPHLLRLAGARDHRLLLPAAALGGGTLLLLADTAARTVLAPRQLPVGVLTAAIGVPVFLWLLHRTRGR